MKLFSVSLCLCLCSGSTGARGRSLRNARSLSQCGGFKDVLMADPAGSIHLKPSQACEKSGIELEDTSDIGGGQNAAWIEAGDWISWDVFIPKTGLYDISYRIASPDGNGGLQFEGHGGVPVFATHSFFPGTGDWQVWTTISHAVTLEQGYQTVAVKALAPGWNLNWVKIAYRSCIEPTFIGDEAVQIEAEDYCNMHGVAIHTTPAGDTYVGWLDAGDWVAYFNIHVEESAFFNVTYRIASPEGAGGLLFEKYGGHPVYGYLTDFPITGDWYTFETITHQVYLQEGHQMIAVKATAPGWNLDWFRIEKTSPETESPTIDISTMPSDIPTSVPSMSPTRACTKTKVFSSVTTRIEAEDYCEMHGVVIGTTHAGDVYIGWSNPGSWVAYFSVDVQEASEYEVVYRLASPGGKGGLLLEAFGGDPVYGYLTDFPSTSNWHTFTTISHHVSLPAGEQMIAIKATDVGWNLDWFEITKVDSVISTLSPSASPTKYDVCKDHSETFTIAVSGTTHIPAYAYCSMVGITTGMTAETEYFVGWIDAWDWMAYQIKTEDAGEYKVTLSIASPSGGGGLKFQAVGGIHTYGEISALPSTGHWLEFHTVSTAIYLPAGKQVLVVMATAPGWNVKWIELEKLH